MGRAVVKRQLLFTQKQKPVSKKTIIKVVLKNHKTKTGFGKIPGGTKMNRNFKKMMTSMVAGGLALSLAACGTSGTSSDTGSDTNNAGSGETLQVWTLSEDLKTYADYYMEKNPDKKVEVTIISPADYPTKVSTALRGKSSTPDIIVGEPQMLDGFMKAGYFEDLSQAPYNAEDYRDQLVDYVFEAGSDDEGIVRALSYQVTPGGILYRRDIAQAVYGDDSPEFMATKFADMDAMLQTANEMKAAGYKVFSDTGNLRWFTNVGDDPQPWVVDNKLQMTDGKMQYFDTAVKLYQEDLTAFAGEWSAAWYASMAGPIPATADAVEDFNGEEGASVAGPTTEVFSYALPTWGSLILRDNAGDNAGKFGITTGMSPYFAGGTFVGINTYSKNKDAAWDFMKFVTLDEETATWWSEVSNGDIVSNKAVLEANKDLENEMFGGQKTYQFWLDQAQSIDISLITEYDDQIGAFFGQAINAVQLGEKTKEAALAEFYQNVKSVYPKLELPTE